MATTARQALEGHRQKGYTGGVDGIDQAAVDKMVAQARTATPEQRATVIRKLTAMVEAGERAGGQSLETMVAAIEAMEAL